LGAFNAFLFKEMLPKEGPPFGRPALESCISFFLLAVATLVFHQENKRRIEAFQVVVALAMFFPLLAIQ
jgi:hypothetical protein